MIKQTGEKYGLMVKMSYNTVRGFHMQLCSTGKEGYSVDNLPDELIKVTRCKNVFSFTTADLVRVLSQYQLASYDYFNAFSFLQ